MDSGMISGSRRSVWWWARRALAAAGFASLVTAGSLMAEEAVRDAPVPAAVSEAVKDAAPPGPDEVVVGAYINDIQELDFRTHSYAVDLYVWLRWKNPELNPEKTLEFMNRYAPSDHVRESMYDKPKPMPDGSLYTVIRTQGRFATKFGLEKFPFDTQRLAVIFEDSLNGSGAQVYKADATAIVLNPDVVMPGFRIGIPEFTVADKTYATNFGDIGDPTMPDYSRVTITLPVTRPILALSAKTFAPIALIVICAALVFFVRPTFVDGRIGLAMTALLTLVALQLTSGSSLPDVDYLMMIDKVYFASYMFIIAALVRVVATSWVAPNSEREAAVALHDRSWVLGLGVLYVLSVAGIMGWSLMR